MSFSASERKALEEIYRLFRELEQSSRDADFSPATLSDLKRKIKELRSSSHADLQRLSHTEEHLSATMTLRHFVAFLLPFERALQKDLKDPDFVVIENDKKEKITSPLPLIFVLDNIRSAFNVGSCLRTAECLHIEKIYLTGYTPSPEQGKVEKTAMGTHEHVPWESAPRTSELLPKLKSQGYRLIALETAEKARDLYEEFPLSPTVFVVGNERFGLDAETLKLCDEIRRIPLRGQKNSLNVGVSLAVAGFEWARQRGTP